MGLSVITINQLKLCVGSQPENWWRKRYCLAPLCCEESVSCSLALTEWPGEGLWSSPVTECMYLPSNTDLHLAELGGGHEGGGDGALQMNCNIASDCKRAWQLHAKASVWLQCCSSSPVLVRVAYFFFLLIVHAVSTSSHFPSFPFTSCPPREISCMDASLTWVSWRTALGWCPLPSPGLN